MSLKDFNYKQFFFDHGERIGIGVAGFIALCLVLPLFWPGSGFLSASAGANAENLDKLAVNVDNGIRTNTPGADDKPGDPTDKLVAFSGARKRGVRLGHRLAFNRSSTRLFVAQKRITPSGPFGRSGGGEVGSNYKGWEPAFQVQFVIEIRSRLHDVQQPSP